MCAGGAVPLCLNRGVFDFDCNPLDVGWARGQGAVCMALEEIAPLKRNYCNTNKWYISNSCFCERAVGNCIALRKTHFSFFFFVCCVGCVSVPIDVSIYQSPRGEKQRGG